MQKRVIYIVKSRLHYYPPCMAQIQMLDDLGIPVEVWYGSSEQSALDVLAKRNIPSVRLCDRRTKLPKKLDSAYNWFMFRQEIRKHLKTVDAENTILWFGNVETMIPVKGLLNKFHYVISVLELLDDSANALKRKLAMPMARKADAVVACQLTRAYIMRSWWKLDRVPYVMPNKPYGNQYERNCIPSCELTKGYIEKLAGQKVIIFQGILQHADYLEQIAMALSDLGGEYLFVLMGSDERDKTLVKRIQTIYPNTLHIPYVPAPLHLEITSYADIGIVFYRDDSLNRAYCAPNKIYEYAQFGIPMISNRIPGLMDTVGAVGAAECVELKRENIADAICRIEAQYEKYADNSSAFFAGTDNCGTVREVYSRLMDKLS